MQIDSPRSKRNISFRTRRIRRGSVDVYSFVIDAPIVCAKICVWVSFCYAVLSVFYCLPRKKEQVTRIYTTHTYCITKYLVMCKVYTDEGGIKSLYYIRSLKLMDYLQIQTVNP